MINFKKGQAIIEYVLILSITYLIFISLEVNFDKSIASFFKMIGNFFSKY